MVLILLAAALLPVFITGPEFTVHLRYVTLPLIVLMTLILIGFGIYFLSNYRLLSLLEREDWPALAYYLEQKIFVKGKYSVKNVRLLASSYMVISDYPSVLKLESKAFLIKPSVVEKNILIFGAARILSGKHTEAAAFFKTYLEKGKINAKDAEWVRWFYGFSLLLGGVFSKVEPEFLSLASSSSDVLMTGLSAYFLSNNIAKRSPKPDECNSAAETGRWRVQKVLKNAGSWKKEADKMSTEIHVAIIRKYVDEAGKWLFEKKAVEKAPEKLSSEKVSKEKASENVSKEQNAEGKSAE
jgi:hypothetical protein